MRKSFVSMLTFQMSLDDMGFQKAKPEDGSVLLSSVNQRLTSTK